MSKLKNLPNLLKVLKDKIDKTGQTRGSGDNAIYQNRVKRNNTVLIPYKRWDQVSSPPSGESSFENGFICLITPEDYFRNSNIESDLRAKSLALGENALVFYETRSDWVKYNPETLGWSHANNRRSPLKGKYVARVAATTSKKGEKICRGFNTGKKKGAGIRLFEYASSTQIKECGLQLEALFWMCYDSLDSVCKSEIEIDEATKRRDYCFTEANSKELLDNNRLKQARLINNEGYTTCPLCLERLSSHEFFQRLVQATGREVHDLTVTEVNLFHIKELRYGEYNHKTYNLGWGHHHCNVVVRDSGIDETLKWMHEVLNKNIENGHFLV